MTKKDKGFSIQDIKNKAKEVNTRIVHESGVKYNPIFPQSYKDKLIVELVETAGYFKEKEMDNLQSEADVLIYINFLIMKYFSDLGEHTEDMTYEELYSLAKDAHDSGIMEIFMTTIFNSKEVAKVIQQIVESMNIIVELGDNLNK